MSAAAIFQAADIFTKTTCVCGSMTPKIMLSEMNVYYTSCSCCHFTRSHITYRENSLIRLKAFSPYVVFEPVSHHLWYENEFVLSATFEDFESQSQSAVIVISEGGSLSISLILLPPHAISSGINRFYLHTLLKYAPIGLPDHTKLTALNQPPSHHRFRT